MPNRAQILKERLLASLGCPWQELLPASAIELVLAEEQVSYRQCLYTPVVTLWMFLSQVIDADKSLQNAVSRALAWLSAAGVEVPSSDTGAYSKARKRLPERVVKRLLKQSAAGLEAQVQREQRWCGRPVKVCDGTSILMSDTPANQQAYPQSSNQKAGCGFPIAQLVVIFSLTTGAVLDAMLAPFVTSELRLARELYHQLQAEDVVLADSAFGTYADLALVLAAGADGVFRKHHARHTDFRRGKKLGIGDHMVTWWRPAPSASAVSEPDFARLPFTLRVREVHLRLVRQGFRTRDLILVTTLLDPQHYPKSKLAELYARRWQAAEVNLRHLKTTLNMEMLATRTPSMVRKDIWVHMMAYNLLRTLMWNARPIAPDGKTPHLSLQGTRQVLGQFIPLLATASQPHRRLLHRQLVVLVARQLLPLRPGRIEPRVRKRRPKPFPLMTQPRSTLKRKLAA
ncbi:MAG: IS4 family transposase [Cyanobacteria bacterium P01_D01_bin.123]